MVDRRNHLRRGAVVVQQGVHRLRAITRCQIGGQIGAAKTVNRLLGVADQQQSRIAGLRVGVDFRQRPPLPRVGVLKLIHQGDRVLPANRLGQTRTGQMQSRVQAGEQIRKIKLTALLFAAVVAVRNRLRGVGQQSLLRRLGIALRIAPGLHGGQGPGGVLRFGAADLGFVTQGLQAKFGHQLFV